jgi:hypothetical protein
VIASKYSRDVKHTAVDTTCAVLCGKRCTTDSVKVSTYFCIYMQACGTILQGCVHAYLYKSAEVYCVSICLSCGRYAHSMESWHSLTMYCAAKPL